MTASVSRRDVATASAALLGVLVAPCAARAYDVVPELDADFAKTEKLRKEREQISDTKIGNHARRLATDFGS